MTLPRELQVRVAFSSHNFGCQVNKDVYSNADLVYEMKIKNDIKKKR